MAEIAEDDLRDVFAALEEANREMNGTARLLGAQHEAIVALSEVLLAVLTAPTEHTEDQARDAAWLALARWGTSPERR